MISGKLNLSFSMVLIRGSINLYGAERDQMDQNMDLDNKR